MALCNVYFPKELLNDFGSWSDGWTTRTASTEECPFPLPHLSPEDLISWSNLLKILSTEDFGSWSDGWTTRTVSIGESPFLLPRLSPESSQCLCCVPFSLFVRHKNACRWLVLDAPGVHVAPPPFENTQKLPQVHLLVHLLPENTQNFTWWIRMCIAYLCSKNQACILCRCRWTFFLSLDLHPCMRKVRTNNFIQDKTIIAWLYPFRTE